MRELVYTLTALGIVSLLAIAYFGVELGDSSYDEDFTSSSAPLILFWTPIFGVKPNFSEVADCPRVPNCKFSSNLTDFARADAVVFHSHDIRENWTWPHDEKTQTRISLPDNPANERQRFVFASLEASPSLLAASWAKWWRNCKSLRLVSASFACFPI